METPRKFIIAKLSIHKLGSSVVLILIKSFGIINLRGCVGMCYVVLAVYKASFHETAKNELGAIWDLTGKLQRKVLVNNKYKTMKLY